MDDQHTGLRVLFNKDVCVRIGLAKTTLYKMIAAGTFPKPRQIGGRKMGWPSSQVDDWINAWAKDAKP